MNQSLCVAVNLSKHKYAIYSETGILLHRVDYSEQVDEYGVPIQVSQNGKFFLFQKKEMTGVVHILILTTEGLSFFKTIDVKESIDNYIE